MSFHNIFEKKPERKAKIEAKKIIIDIHEKNSLVPANLLELGADTNFQQLEIGDYLVGEVIIERKTISDFVSSMLSRRLLEQLKNMQQYENKLLILEKNNNEHTNINPNAIKGMILSISLDFKIPIIFTNNEKETAEYLFLLAKQQAKEKTELSMHSRIPKTKKEQQKYIIESFQGIGPATAEKLLNEFKTIKNIINASQEELEKVISKKAEIFNIIDEKY